MTRRLCSECLLEWTDRELRLSQRDVERSIDLVREHNPEIPTRSMALIKIRGFEQTPPDAPDEYWKKNHPTSEPEVPS